MSKGWHRLIAGAWCGLAVAAVMAQWSEPVTVSGNAALDGGRVRLATTGGGHWIVMWERGGVPSSAMYSRSGNRGETWSGAAELMTPINSISQGMPTIAANVTSGTFLAVWQVDEGFNGVPDAAVAMAVPSTTSFPTINMLSNFENYVGLGAPVVASVGGNSWVLAGTSTGPSGGDEAIDVWRSGNDGLVWMPVADLGLETSSVRFDRLLDLAADNSDNLILVTESRVGSPTAPTSRVVRFSRATDGGSLWSALEPIDSGNAGGERPKVAAAAAGRFAVLSQNGAELQVYQTINAGTEWTGPTVANHGSDSSSVNLQGHDLAMDSEGNAVAVWSAREATGSRNRLYYATSRDYGQSWSEGTVAVSANADAEFTDEWPAIEYDQAGRWAVAWQRRSYGTTESLSIQSASLVFPVRADLSVSQEITPDPATVGEPVTYRMTVRNDGPSPATGVVLVNSVPSVGTVQSIAQSQGDYAETSSTITFNFGDVAVNATADAEVTMLINESGFFSNLAEVFSNEEDVDMDDRVSTHSVRVLVEGVDLTGEWQKFIARPPRRPLEGRLDIESKLVVRNMGNQRARGFKILFMFSDDNILSEDDALVAVKSISHLGPGNERKVDLDIKARRYVPWHGRHLIAIIEAEHRIDEADEFNNVVISDVIPLVLETP